ncbi:MAG: hypothetical protein PW792_08270 [Acidobacteriaceae bacterium]|nr:hypothetical protein [Acidobacteriaceae bacterium]
MNRHRDRLAHEEMVAALTTAATINHSMNPPEKGVSWTEFAPHFREFKRSGGSKLNEKQLQQVSDFNQLALELADRLRKEASCPTISQPYEPNSNA